MASFAPVNTTEPLPPQEVDNTVKKPYRSYKKKFLKLRHAFRDLMRESNMLYGDELHAQQIARRLKEENDQLLELLLDVNDSTKIPAHLRYDLRSPPPGESEVPDLEPDNSPSSYEEVQQAQAALQEARIELDAGQLDLPSFEETEAALTAIISKGRSLTALLKTSHTLVDCVPTKLIPDLIESTPTGYLTPAHEEDFLTTLDEYLEAPHPDQPLPPKPRFSERERERETQVNNPMSVTNWLSRHRPKEFVDEVEPSTEKPAKAPRKQSPKAPTSTPTNPPRSTTTKREKILPKPEEDVLDEDGSALAGLVEDAAGPQKKRKRGQDDDAYRPKGGGSKRRKRASTRNSTADVVAEAAGA